MIIDVYAKGRWIFWQVLIHSCFLIPAVSLCYYLTNSMLLTSGVSLLIVSLYSILIVGQIRKPLIRLDENKLAILNLFSKGLVEINLTEIEAASISDVSFTVEFVGGQVNTRISSLIKEEKEKLFAIVQSLKAGLD
ncbi:hypothetical protein [Litorivivens sp.]|uniref:hypothetical protein n=1 Tax=Litorivivens sp. TaxID=2020868 RepID=UPI003565F89C